MELIQYLKQKLGDNLVSIIQFGSSIYGKENPEDIDILVITENPVYEDLSFDRYSIIVLTKKDFVRNILEESPLLIGIVLMGYKVLYDKNNFFYTYLPAILNRISREDLIYKRGKIYRCPTSSSRKHF